MNIVINHVPTTSKKRSRIGMTPIYITIHSTGNPKSTAQNERDYLTNPSNTNETGYHYVVDEKQIIECIPPNEVAWHAGDGRGDGNMKSIGIEICESGNREKTLENALWLVRHLRVTYKIQKIVRHYDWSRKICPRIMYDQGSWKTWEVFHRQCIEEERKLHWGQKAIDWMMGEGLITSPKEPDEPITWAEFATVVQRITK